MNLYQDFIDKVEKFIPERSFHESNKAEIENLLDNTQFKEFLEHSPAVVGIFNNVTMGYEYMSNNSKSILGYEKEQFIGPGGMEKVLETFKVEHAQIYNKYIFPLIYEYIDRCRSTKNITGHRFTGSFQVKRKNGQYKWCMQQIKVMSTNTDMFPFLSLIFISDISDIKKDEDIDFVISYKDNDGEEKNVHAITIPSSGQAISFSKRELEILSCIKKGLRTKEIASALVISEHTIHTHRKNILKKSNGLTMIEIIQMMYSKNLL